MNQLHFLKSLDAFTLFSWSLAVLAFKLLVSNVVVAKNRDALASPILLERGDNVKSIQSLLSVQDDDFESASSDNECNANASYSALTNAITLEDEGGVPTTAVLHEVVGTSMDVGVKKLSERIAEIGFTQTIDVTTLRPLFSTRSKYQDIEVYESKFYGKILVLDGVLQITERDGNSYNEMMSHIPLMAHKNPKRVLVIGGGDGYVVSEVLKHNSVEVVDHVDLDEEVIRTCEKYFKWGKSAWSDSRVNLRVGDGAAWVRNAPSDYYDVIIQDSSDPFSVDDNGSKTLLPSSVLYTDNHFRNIRRILRDGGKFMFQAETFIIPSDLSGIHTWRLQAMDIGFSSVRYGTVFISTYPTGQIGFLLCEIGKNHFNDDSELLSETQIRHRLIEEAGMETTYYHPKLQISSFDLPYWVHKSIYGSTEVI